MGRGLSVDLYLAPIAQVRGVPGGGGGGRRGPCSPLPPPNLTPAGLNYLVVKIELSTNHMAGATGEGGGGSRHGSRIQKGGGGVRTEIKVRK